MVAGDRSTFRIGAPSLVDSAESDGETATCDRSSRSEESEEREHGEKPPGRAGVCKNRPFALQNITSNSLSFSLCRFSFRVFLLKYRLRTSAFQLGEDSYRWHVHTQQSGGKIEKGCAADKRENHGNVLHNCLKLFGIYAGVILLRVLINGFWQRFYAKKAMFTMESVRLRF